MNEIDLHFINGYWGLSLPRAVTIELLGLTSYSDVMRTSGYEEYLDRFFFGVPGMDSRVYPTSPGYVGLLASFRNTFFDN